MAVAPIISTVASGNHAEGMHHTRSSAGDDLLELAGTERSKDGASDAHRSDASDEWRGNQAT